jgi:hypothetical protein
LIAVLLLLMLMLTLAAALSVGARTTSLIARNHNSAVQARAAAEAGLSHATALAVTYIVAWRANGFAASSDALDALLAGPDGLTGDAGSDADNGGLGQRDGISGGGIPPGERLAIGGADGVGYEARVIDDTGGGEFAEDANPYDDTNRRLTIRATGHGPDNSKVTLEALIGPAVLPAIVSEGAIELDGTIEIHGPADASEGGAIHSNRDLSITGNGGEVSGLVTATGTFTSDNDTIIGAGGARRVEIPAVSAVDYEPIAGSPAASPRPFKLRSDGTVINIDTGAACNVSNAAEHCGVSGWSVNSGEWVASAPTPGTYYVEGDVRLNGNAGSVTAPLALTLIAEGNIQVLGSTYVVPDTEGLLFVTNKDLRITGSFTAISDQQASLNTQGRLLVHEQLELGGNITLAGQIQVEDAADTSSLVTANRIHGNVFVAYRGGLNIDSYTVIGWRDVREAK